VRRRGLDAGRIPRQSADETQAQRQDRLSLDMEVIQGVEGVGSLAVVGADRVIGSMLAG